jgi:hypothetical protein
MQLQQVVRLLDVENHQLRDEVARLAKLARERSYHARRVRLALDDALLLARVVVRRRRWAVDDLATIERRLTQAAQRAMTDARAYRLHLNRHGTR